MKLSKQTVKSMLKREVQVVLTRVTFVSKSKPNSSFKRRKTKRGRSSGSSSNKENDDSRNVNRRMQLNLNPIQIEKALEDQRDGHSELLQLSTADRKLLLAALPKKGRTTKYSKIDSSKTKSSGSSSNRTAPQSQSFNVSQVTTATAGTSYNTNGVDQKKKNKCVRKDSGIDVESPKKKKSAKRKFSDLLDSASDNERETDNIVSAVSILDSSEGEIPGLEDIIQSHSSHRCADKIHRKMNNVETSQTPDGTFVRKDFVIRIKQCCFNQPSKDSNVGRTTSVVASTSKCENIKKSSMKDRRDLAVEKKIDIKTRTKIGNIEKNCTRTVQSKYVQTTEKSHKKIKLSEPSRMVTRRKAAVNTEFEFFSLTNEKKCSFLVNPNISKTQSDQPNENKSGEYVKKKVNVSYKKLVSKTEIRNQNNNEEPKPSCSKSFYSKSEAKVKISENFITTGLDCNVNKVSKILKDVTLYREENTQSSTSRVIQKITHIEESNTPASRRKPKKASVPAQRKNESLDAETKQVRKSSRPAKPRVTISYNSDRSSDRTRAKQLKNHSHAENVSISVQKKKKSDLKSSIKQKDSKPVKNTKDNDVESSRPKKPRVKISHTSDDEDCSPTWKPPKYFINNSHAENVGISAQKGKKQDLKLSVKEKGSKPVKNTKDRKVEAPKKPSSLPLKRLMKKSEALEKTERFNEQKKKLKNGEKTAISLANTTLPRPITKLSSKTPNNKAVAGCSKTEVARGTSCVKFSSKTPETIPRPENQTENTWNSDLTPCILLDRLDAADISTYAITPLREDRVALPSKSFEDYGIDDVDTDDSTDEEDNPKKVVPEWARSLGHKPQVQFLFPRDTIRDWIRPPATRFTVQSLFF